MLSGCAQNRDSFYLSDNLLDCGTKPPPPSDEALAAAGGDKALASWIQQTITWGDMCSFKNETIRSLYYEYRPREGPDS